MKRYIKSSDDYDLMGGYKYYVAGGPKGDYIGDYNEELAKYYSQKPFDTVYTNDPREAIEAWLTAEDRFPADAAIFTDRPEYEMELCRWVIENEPEFRQMYDSHRCPYKYEYLIEWSNRYKNRAGGLYGYGFPDQIPAFCYG